MELSEKDMEQLLKNHVRIASDAKARIAGQLFAKLGEKKAKGIPHRFFWPLAAALALVAGLLFVPSRGTGLGTVVDCWDDCKLVRGANPPAALGIGTRVGVGDLLITGPNAGMRIKTGDGSLVSVGRGTELECAAPRGGGRPTFDLHRGRVLAKVSHDAGRQFSVKTPDALLKVLGTEFEVKVVDVAPSQEKGKMNISTIKSVATLTALTVLAGAVAVSPLDAADTVVKAGSTASVTASGKTTVDALKARSFIESVIKGNYEKDAHVWFSHRCKGVMSSLYRFDTGSGKTVKIADVAGGGTINAQFDGGAVVSAGALYVDASGRMGVYGGGVVVSDCLMMVGNGGEFLDLSSITKYAPRDPVFSPDGSKLAFFGTEDKGHGNSCGIFVLDFQTMEVKHLYAGGVMTIPAWSLDSSKIVISRSWGYVNQHRLVVIDIGTGKVTETGYDGCGAVFSPDGKRLAYVGAFTKTGQSGGWMGGVPTCGNIFVANYPDGKPMKVTDVRQGGALSPVFSPDGKRIAYIHTYEKDKKDGLFVRVGKSLGFGGGEDTSAYDLRIVDLDGQNDRMISCGRFIHRLSWVGESKLMAVTSDEVVLIDVGGVAVDVKAMEADLGVDAGTEKALSVLTPVFGFYYDAMLACDENRLGDARRDYNDAYVALLTLKSSIKGIDPEFSVDSLNPCLVEFKKMADMSARNLYLKTLKGRVFLMRFYLNRFVERDNRLPGSMKELVEETAAKRSPGKCFALMPDQKPGEPSAFELKKLDDKNVEIWSAPLSWGGWLKARSTLENGKWRPHGEVEEVKAADAGK